MIRLLVMIRILIIAAGATVVLSEPAYAYLDPGSASIALQAIIGAVAAGSLFFRAQIKRLFLMIRGFARGDSAPESKDRDKGTEH